MYVKIYQSKILDLVLEANTRQIPLAGYFGTRHHVSQTQRLFPQQQRKTGVTGNWRHLLKIRANWLPSFGNI